MPQGVVFWSDKAKITYNEVINYLEVKWTPKEIQDFIVRTESVIDKISNEPLLFPVYKSDDHVRQAVIHKTVVLIYLIMEDNTINLITFWQTARNPKKLKL